MKRWLLFPIAAIMSGLPNIRAAEPLMTSEMLDNLKSDYSTQAYNRGAALNTLLSTLETQDLPTQLKEVNRFFNQFQ